MNITSDELIAIHAEQRAKERYGVELCEADRADMVAQVKDGRGLFFKKKEGSSKVSIWLVWWAAASRIVPIYYKTGRVLTVLPTDAFFGPTPAPQSNLAGEDDAVEAMVLSLRDPFPSESLTCAGGMDYWREIMRKAYRVTRAPQSNVTDGAPRTGFMNLVSNYGANPTQEGFDEIYRRYLAACDKAAADARAPSTHLELADRLEEEVQRLDDTPPSLQTQANIRLIDAAHEAAAILRGTPSPQQNVMGLEERIAELEDDLHEAQQVPWPDWATSILKSLKKQGYDPVVDGEVDLGEAFADYLDGVTQEDACFKKRLAEKDAEISRLRHALATTEGSK